MPGVMAQSTFCDDIGRASTQGRFLGRLVPGSTSACPEKVSRTESGQSACRTYAKMLRDKAVPLRQGDKRIARPGRVNVAEVGAGHDVIVSGPGAVAGVINEVRATTAAG